MCTEGKNVFVTGLIERIYAKLLALFVAVIVIIVILWILTEIVHYPMVINTIHVTLLTVVLRVSYICYAVIVEVSTWEKETVVEQDPW